MEDIFDKNIQEIMVDAEVSELDKVLDFVSEYLEELGCNMSFVVKMGVACDEIFMNISSYAYPHKSSGNKGYARIIISQNESLDSIQIMFRDNGIPYDPLKSTDPDVTLNAEERDVGGLGIFMVKKFTDTIMYERDGDENVLIITKSIV